PSTVGRDGRHLAGNDNPRHPGQDGLLLPGRDVSLHGQRQFELLPARSRALDGRQFLSVPALWIRRQCAFSPLPSGMRGHFFSPLPRGEIKRQTALGGTANLFLTLPTRL